MLRNSEKFVYGRFFATFLWHFFSGICVNMFLPECPAEPVRAKARALSRAPRAGRGFAHWAFGGT